MSDEPVSLTLPRTQLVAIDNALDLVESQLERLLTLDEEYDEDDELPERPTQRPFKPVEETRLGPEQERFCRETLMRLLLNPQLDVSDIPHANEALRALDQLRPRLVRLQRLGERASHAHSVLSEHVMLCALIGYGTLRNADQHHGLEPLREATRARRRRGSSSP
ncbi:hypothetical protein [Lysobacter sp. Root494]|uniref:hypothetical protein n=1 Tax=Lysobacter sp. Root494 TaxID=1736549 RepID=UPI0006F26960|nr:hypothetical protein [Lysobacter sp. Root494]KQY55056.1 hypothetical protein ASD14_02530 [Lysobacter sp. Root494]